MKAMTRSHCAEQLVNHHQANNAVMTGTVASRQAMPRRGSKTTMKTKPERALMTRQDRLAYEPSLLASPFLGLTTTRLGEPLSPYVT
jgi:hypothetical protein